MSRPVYELLVYENPVLRNYAFWSSILVMKMLCMTLVTAAQRVRTKIISDKSSIKKASSVFTQIAKAVARIYFPQITIAAFIVNRVKAFANPEDLKIARAVEVKFNDAHVERARRAHRNDLEAIVPYLIISFIYVLTDPRPAVALNLFRICVGCRIIHTLVYAIYVLPQPARALSFFIPHGITWYMAVQSAIVFVN